MVTIAGSRHNYLEVKKVTEEKTKEEEKQDSMKTYQRNEKVMKQKLPKRQCS